MLDRAVGKVRPFARYRSCNSQNSLARINSTQPNPNITFPKLLSRIPPDSIVCLWPMPLRTLIQTPHALVNARVLRLSRLRSEKPDGLKIIIKMEDADADSDVSF